MQNANVLLGRHDPEVGVFVMQQLMHHIGGVLHHQRTVDLGIIRYTRQIQVAVFIDASSLDICPPQDKHLAQTKGRPNLVGVGLKAEAEFKATHRGAGQDGFDVHMILTGSC